MGFFERFTHLPFIKQEDKPMSDTDTDNAVQQDAGASALSQIESAVVTTAGAAFTTIEQDHALLDKVATPLKELLKIANFNIDPIWDTAVDVAKKLDSDTGAAVSAASDATDVFQRLGYTLKVFGHDVEGIWGTVTTAVKSHLS